MGSSTLPGILTGAAGDPPYWPAGECDDD